VDGLTLVTKRKHWLQPAFPELRERQLTLSTNSPSLNAGDGAFITGVTNDLAGNPRVFGVAVDIGAYETQFSAGTPRETAFIAGVGGNVRRGRQPVTFTVVGVFDPSQTYVGNQHWFRFRHGRNERDRIKSPRPAIPQRSRLQATLAMNGHQFRVAVPATVT